MISLCSLCHGKVLFKFVFTLMLTRIIEYKPSYYTYVRIWSIKQSNYRILLTQTGWGCMANMKKAYHYREILKNKNAYHFLVFFI